MKPTTEFSPVEVVTLKEAHCPKCSEPMIKGSNTLCVRCEQKVDAIMRDQFNGERYIEIVRLVNNEV